MIHPNFSSLRPESISSSGGGQIRASFEVAVKFVRAMKAFPWKA
jgi:hypothetical protein